MGQQNIVARVPIYASNIDRLYALARAAAGQIAGEQGIITSVELESVSHPDGAVVDGLPVVIDARTWGATAAIGVDYILPDFPIDPNAS